MFIQFVSDNSGRYAGFRIQYSAFVPAEGKIYPVAKLGGHSHVRNYLVYNYSLWLHYYGYSTMLVVQW